MSEIYKRELHQKTLAELFFYRTSNGEEIDLIIDRKQQLELIEIKNSETFRPKMTKTIETFLDKKNQGYLLYRGKKIPHLDNLQVINYQDYLDVPEK